MTRPRPEPEPRPEPSRFAYGGVAFEVCPGPGLRFTLGEEHERLTGAFSASPTAATIHCAVDVAGRGALEQPLDLRQPRAVRWRWEGERARVSTLGVDVELRRLAAGQLAVRGRVQPRNDGPSSLLTALGSVAVFREGGLVLHSTAVELDGRAILFIGPSGAGKTTAAQHCPGGRWLARDRAAVFPTPLGWYAAGLAGGDEVALPQSPAPVLPLAAIFRIRRGAQPGGTIFTPLSSARGVGVLRESVQLGGLGQDDQERVLEAAARLTRDVAVGEAHTVLDEPLPRALGAFLSARTA